MSCKYLILGGNSLIAGYLKKTLPGDVHAFTKNQLNIGDQTAFEKRLIENSYDTVINCAGAVIPENAPISSLYQLNGTYPGDLAKICFRYGIRFVFISTGRVFDGTSKSPYQEHDAVHPIDDYGLSKYVGERLTENALYHGRYVIFRIPLIFGIKSIHSDNQLLLRLLNRVQSGKKVYVSQDAFNSPSYAGDIATLMTKYLESDLPNGCYHLHNHGMVTIAELAERFFLLLNLSVDLIQVSSTYFKSVYRPSINLSFKSEKLPQHRSWDEALFDFVEELKGTY